MQILLAKEYGFCHGVRIALMKLEEVLENNPEDKVYSIGEIIHNNDVILEYKKKGVEIADSIEDIRCGIGVVRAHGLPHSIITQAQQKGYAIIDATCPYVRKISRIIEKEIEKQNTVYLIGEPTHPEVIASTNDYKDQVQIVDYNTYNRNAFSFPTHKCALVAQTTIAVSRFTAIAADFVEHCDQVFVYNTICPSTRRRQSAAVETAKQTDGMIILGGKNSSNTARLFEICSRFVPSVHIENIQELEPAFLKDKQRLGITAGASTPDRIIQEAIHVLENWNG